MNIIHIVLFLIGGTYNTFGGLNMKKTLSTIVSGALLLALGLTMAGCGKGVAKISPEYDGEYSIDVTQNVLQANTANMSVSFGADDGAGHVIVTETVTNALNLTSPVTTTYRVYDLAAKSYLSTISSATPLHILDEGVFYTENVSYDMSTGVSSPDGTYTFYSVNGDATPAASKGSIDDSVFYAEDGSRWYVNVDGEFVQETNPFAMILSNENTQKVGKYYITTSGDSINVFDKKGKYKHSFNFVYSFGLTEDMSPQYTWSAGYNVFMQTLSELPIYEEEYDVMIGDKKFNVTTLSYSLKNNKVKELKNFDYIVTDECTPDIESEDPLDYAILGVKEIKDKRVSAMELVQSFGDNGKVYYDVQDLVPGAVDIEFTDAGYTLIEDYAGFTYIYEKSKCVLTIPANATSVDFASGDIVYYMNGDTLNIYDLDEEMVVNSATKVQSASTNNNGNIVYSTYDEITMMYTYYVYDVDAGMSNTIRTISPATESIVSGSFASSYVCISYTYTDYNTGSVSTKYTLSFPDSSVAEISGVDSAQISSTYWVDNVKYTIFSTRTATAGGFDPTTGLPVAASTMVSYHIGVETFPTVE